MRTDGTKADQIDGTLGEGSAFHALHGYYAQGVGLETAKLPRGWQDRLVPFDAAGIAFGRGHCLEPHDLSASKLVAGRPKDFEFVDAIVERGLLDLPLLLSRLNSIPRYEVPAQKLAKAIKWVEQRLPPIQAELPPYPHTTDW